MSGFRHELLVVSLNDEQGGGGCAPNHPDSNVCKKESPNTNGTEIVQSGFGADALHQLMSDLG